MSPFPKRLACIECGMQFTSNGVFDLVCEDCEAEVAQAELDEESDPIVDQKID
jgi:hypothetical protein